MYIYYMYESIYRNIYINTHNTNLYCLDFLVCTLLKKWRILNVAEV